MTYTNHHSKYSICITCRNEAGTIEHSLSSILDQIDDRFEVVIVDSHSDDGTHDTLMTLAKAGAIKLVTERCSRGEGRQIAFENSSGDYIVAHMDMDDTFKPSLISLLELYHQRCEGNLLLAIFNAKKQLRGVQNIIVSTRELMASLGGWRDLQRFEDWDLWSRAAKIGKYCWAEFPLLDTWNRHPERKNFRQNLKFRYLRYRDSLRLGIRIFSEDEEVGVSQRVVALMARLGASFHHNYEDEFNKNFKPYNKAYQLQP
ncbi:MAG: glycosyltransferase family 2 protein [Candidatus Bathyarchaeota archaeon]|nr:MAG: glycosyltransferase family 2 protein [Candidatus Bathyarchaeota archaeon]